MSDDRHQISSKQFFIFLISTQIGIGILTLPSELTKNVGHDAWISVFLAGLLYTSISVLILMLMKRYSDKSILSINKLLYGKYLGSLLNFLIWAYLLFASAVGLRLFTEVIRITVLKTTPPLILTSFVLVPTIYLTVTGLKNICRYASINILLHSIILLFLLLLYKHMRFSFLLPIFHQDVATILSGIKYTTFAFIGFELIAIVYPHISDKENVTKNLIYANVYTLTFYTIITIAIISFCGDTLTKDLVFPIFTLFRSYNAPVFERLDLFFIGLWFPAMATSFRNYFFSAYHVFITRFTRFNLKLSTSGFIVLVIILSRLPKNFIEVPKYSGYLENASYILMAHLIISLLLSFILKKGVSSHVQKN